MKETTETVTTRTILIEEDEIRAVLRDYIEHHYGSAWRDASVAIYEVARPWAMGQIDEAKTTVAKATLTKTEKT